MSPETWSGGGMIVASGVQTLFEETVGKDSGLGQTINAATNFKVDPAVADALGEVIFCDEFFGNVGEADADVFGTIERSAEIEVTDVEGDEFGASTREDAVDHELDKFEWGGFGADVAWVADVVASNGDASAVGMGFFGTDFTNNLGVSDFFAAVGGISS